jgi:ABC-type branched-subunit amino acid transport system substrate-binding protein
MNLKIKILILFLVVVFLGLIVFGANSGYFILNKIDSEYTYTIGAVLPLTGHTQLMGNYNKMGMDLALEEINK